VQHESHQFANLLPLMHHYDEASNIATKQQQFYGTGGNEQNLEQGVLRAQSFFVKGQRQRLNIVPVCQSLLLPWLFFCLLYAVMSFSVHYNRPTLCLVVVGLCGLVVLLLGAHAAQAAFRKWRGQQEGEPPRAPSWAIFLFISFVAAWLLGVVLGNLNFAANFQPYYDYTNLNTHWGIDPAKTPGQELMDAGRFYFTNRSVLDLRRSMGFRNLDTYCVAPVTVKSADDTLEPLATYDFWAVGIGCCEGNMADFHCGQFNDPKAHQGLRLLRDDQRSFFRLAVQQAEATYGIKSKHPLFLYWTTDCDEEMDNFREDGYKYFMVGMMGFFSWQLLCVGAAVYGFVRIGYW